MRIVADCWQQVGLHGTLCMMSEGISIFGRKLFSSGFGEIGSGGARLPRAASIALLVLIKPTASAATSGIHEEVAHCVEF